MTPPRAAKAFAANSPATPWEPEAIRCRDHGHRDCVPTTGTAAPSPPRTAGTVADHQRHRECIANGGVRDVVVSTSHFTTLTCDDAISSSCIANDRLRYILCRLAKLAGQAD